MNDLTQTMKHEAHSRNRLAVSIRRLRITTQLRVHPDFFLESYAFARRSGVDLASEVNPENHLSTDPDDPDSGEGRKKSKWNIHFVQHKAIRIFVERDDEGFHCIRSIDLEPSLLLYGKKRHWLSEGDLTLSLSILRDQVSRILADPVEAQHIVPGFVRNENPKAFWSVIDSEMLMEGTQTPCLHGLSHPSTGPAQGKKKDRIQLGDEAKDKCVIRFKKAKWESVVPDGTQTVEGMRVRLILKKSKLASEFKPFGKTALFEDQVRLVAFSERSVACVHQAMMSQLEGMCLPVPTKWRHRDRGKPVTHAKTIALVSKLTSIPIEELMAMDKEIRQPSESTQRRLRKDVKVEESRLHPFPVAELFSPTAYASLQSDSPMPLNGYLDPEIAEVYG